jgi:hypothetical protein
MEERQRKRKQVFIAFVFFLIFGGFSFLIYRSVRPPLPEPTPNPTINLSPIKIIDHWLFNIKNNDYDFLAKVTNPNTEYGSPSVEYELIFFNSAGTQVSKKTGSFYILPGQTKYIVDLPLKFQEPVSRVEFIIKSVDWQKLAPLAAQGVSLIVKNYENTYTQIQQPGVFSKAEGRVLNDSDFDLDKVDVIVILFDENNVPLAANRTIINTFLSGTTRGFEVAWPLPFSGNVARVDAEANTNIFENSNFLRQYGGQERFKQMY